MREQLTTIALDGTIIQEIDLILDPLLDAYRGRQKQWQLFKRIGMGSFAHDCKEIGYPDYSNQWEALSETRNHYAHSADDPRRPLGNIDIHSFINDTMAVFARLHNRYNVYTTEYKAMTEKRNPEELKAIIDQLQKECEQPLSPP